MAIEWNKETYMEIRYALMPIKWGWNKDYKDMMIGIKRFMCEKYRDDFPACVQELKKLNHTYGKN